MNNSNAEHKKEMRHIKGFSGVAVFFILFAVLMSVFFANNVRIKRILDKKQVVAATFIDIQETHKIPFPSLDYTSWTLVFEYIDTDGTIYRGTDRKYDNEALARLHLGETKKIRIDGKGDYIDFSITASSPVSFLIAAIACLTVATVLIVLSVTPLRHKARAFGAKTSSVLAGKKRPIASLVLLGVLIFFVCIGTAFFASGLNEMSKISQRREFIKTGKHVEATIVYMYEIRTTGPNGSTSNSAGYNFEYEYIDNENEYTVYTGIATYVSSMTSSLELQKAHNQYIGKKIKIIIDGQGNSVLATATPENPIDNAYFWVGISIYTVGLGLLIVYLTVRFGKAKDGEMKVRNS